MSHIRPVTLSVPVRPERPLADPSYQQWIDLIASGVAESQQPAWSGSVDALATKPAASPLLHGATLRIDTAHASRFVRQLGAALGIVDIGRVDPLSLVLVGVERDIATVQRLAERLAIPADTVAVFGQLAALPVLLNAARRLDAEAARSWHRGYCPVCGAWPSIVEMRGIQRERRLRCGCCSSDWVLPVLRCAFCDETEHAKLGYLSNDDGDQHIRTETCNTCHGYLKTLSTLSILPFTTLARKDLETLADDLVARDRGYARPAVPGWQVEVEIVQ
jgi:FdhE protein